MVLAYGYIESVDGKRDWAKIEIGAPIVPDWQIHDRVTIVNIYDRACDAFRRKVCMRSRGSGVVHAKRREHSAISFVES
jgi:hypothetical protein